MTIWSGATGAGKTTLLSQISLQLCKDHMLPTLWGSFELRPERLLELMQQQSRSLADTAEVHSLPMYIMNFHGATAISTVLRHMTQSVRAYGVKHIVIDNLQFMAGVRADGDRFLMQDLVVQSLRSVRCAPRQPPLVAADSTPNRRPGPVSPCAGHSQHSTTST